MAYMDSAISSLPLAAVCHATIIYRRQCKECSCCNAAAALKWGNMAANPMQPANTKQMEPASCYLDLPSLPNPGIQRHVRSQRDLPTRREIDSMDAMNGDQPCNACMPQGLEQNFCSSHHWKGSYVTSPAPSSLHCNLCRATVAHP
mmetsp:Transcript_30230/g.85412  ORF Transcript_30230/g.85412 Transcript_30230/m.85412 type:complete len:146 (+) Transcript_30230:3081-3518(+)